MPPMPLAADNDGHRLYQDLKKAGAYRYVLLINLHEDEVLVCRDGRYTFFAASWAEAVEKYHRREQPFR